MIVYRKGGLLRLLRHTAPDPPFWAAGTALPYSARRTSPVVVDWINLVASRSEYEEVEIASAVRETILRSNYLRPPLLVDATGPAEAVYARGAEAAVAAAEAGLDTLLLISTEGAIPARTHDLLTIAIAAWPTETISALETLGSEAAGRGHRHGVVVPVIPPETTELPLLEEIADAAKSGGANFLAAVPIDVDPTARRALAERRDVDQETLSLLFETDLELLTVATERHVAALAIERNMADLVPVPGAEPGANWSVSAALASTGNRMIRMNRDVELGWEMLRASRTIAALGTPIRRIAAAASLAIIEPLEPMIAEAIEEWLADGSSELMGRVDRDWRLRRDYGVE
ncbi:MAG: hypothetical protein ABR517_11875 [Thermoanaerobaculia bacterium]